ncbi:acetate uptake transporter [Eggerthellaceae bacterium zg-997]|nr:acetate uptake transporter [Eggerthellaceae bacterium zg-997]
MAAIKEKKANPGPLGLLGFGCTTILLNLHNAGVLEQSIAIVAMGLCLGGLAQVIAGILEFRGGNTFPGTAFTAYGLFWWSLVLIWVNPFAEAGIAKASHASMGFYLLLWCLFTLCMFIGTLKHNRATQVVFGSLALLFLVLALENFLAMPSLAVVAGVVGIFCGASAVYTAFGTILEEEYGRQLLPLG